jgi:hypothetical protein
MYPHNELSRLAAHKAGLRDKIALVRADCAEAASWATQPLAWLDRIMAFSRRLSPLAVLATVPLGVIAQRLVFSRIKIIGPLLRWAPVVFATVRSLRAR